MCVSVRLYKVANATDAEAAFLREAVRLLREALRTPGFGAAVRGAEYGCALWKGVFGGSRELSGAQVWERVVGGREAGCADDHTISLTLELLDLPAPGDADGRAIVARTRLGELPIRSARWFVARCMAAGDRVNLAAHLMHQWMHVSGFVHGGSDDRRGDVPDVLARLVREALTLGHREEIDPELTRLLEEAHGDCICTAKKLTVAA